MLSGDDITSEIAAKVDEDTAEKITIEIGQNPNTGGGYLSLNGPQVVKLGIPFSLTASALNDYIFSGWTVTGSGKIRFSSTTATYTTVTIVKSAADIAIYGNFTKRPEVTSTDPYNHGQSGVLVPVTVSFSEDMDASTLVFGSQNIAIYGKPAGIDVPLEDFTSRFAAPSYDAATFDLTLTPKSGALSVGFKIFVVVSTGVKSAGGVPLYNAYQFDYVTK
jgi:hypothetical protein